MTLYRIEIDHSSCIGYGGCVKEAPDVFWLEDGLAYCLDTSADERVLEAVDLCPVSAIVAVPVEQEAQAA
jgi:ferredoxin